MLKHLLFLLLSVSILSSCSNEGATFDKNRAELDEVYGACDNPLRPLSKRKYKECIAAERAGGESFFDLQGDNLNDLFNRGGNYVVQYNVNPYLWQAALDVTKTYPLKIADNQGGYIETNWINKQETPNNRCLIKVRVTSQELISTGVSTNFICEEKFNDQWTVSNNDYIEEEKQLTLKILSTAATLSEAAL